MNNIFKCKVCNSEIDKIYDSIYGCGCKDKLGLFFDSYHKHSKNVNSLELELFEYKKNDNGYSFNADFIYVHGLFNIVVNLPKKEIYKSTSDLDNFEILESLNFKDYNFDEYVLSNIESCEELRDYLDKAADYLIFL